MPMPRKLVSRGTCLMVTSKSVEVEQEAALQKPLCRGEQRRLTRMQDRRYAGRGELDLLDVQMLRLDYGARRSCPSKGFFSSPGSVINWRRWTNLPILHPDIRFATADVVVVDDCFASIKEILGVDHENPKTRQA